MPPAHQERPPTTPTPSTIVQPARLASKRHEDPGATPTAKPDPLKLYRFVYIGHGSSEKTAAGIDEFSFEEHVTIIAPKKEAAFLERVLISLYSAGAKGKIEIDAALDWKDSAWTPPAKYPRLCDTPHFEPPGLFGLIFPRGRIIGIRKAEEIASVGRHGFSNRIKKKGGGGSTLSRPSDA